ncbi:MAG: hypothetical protein M1457_02815 [bacterium]|nr:hypothetical protein [bacterium]
MNKARRKLTKATIAANRETASHKLSSPPNYVVWVLPTVLLCFEKGLDFIKISGPIWVLSAWGVGVLVYWWATCSTSWENQYMAWLTKRRLIKYSGCLFIICMFVCIGIFTWKNEEDIIQDWIKNSRYKSEEMNNLILPQIERDWGIVLTDPYSVNLYIYKPKSSRVVRIQSFLDFTPKDIQELGPLTNHMGLLIKMIRDEAIHKGVSVGGLDQSLKQVYFAIDVLIDDINENEFQNIISKIRQVKTGLVTSLDTTLDFMSQFCPSQSLSGSFPALQDSITTPATSVHLR